MGKVRRRRDVTLQRFDRAGLVAAPWKNGGGTTCEIACWPPSAGLADFDWRVSIARIDAPGPFSSFAGVARTIVLLDGSGVRLRSNDGAIDHRLGTPLVPFSFDGSAVLDCELLGGASSDFNVMVRGGRFVVDVRVLHGAASLPVAPHGVLLAWRGEWQVRGVPDDAAPSSSRAASLAHSRSHLQPQPQSSLTLAAGAGIWWGGELLALDVEGSGADAALIAVSLQPDVATAIQEASGTAQAILRVAASKPADRYGRDFETACAAARACAMQVRSKG